MALSGPDLGVECRTACHWTHTHSGTPRCTYNVHMQHTAYLQSDPATLQLKHIAVHGGDELIASNKSAMQYDHHLQHQAATEVAAVCFMLEWPGSRHSLLAPSGRKPFGCDKATATINRSM